jgi:hypothetical protein
MVRREGRSTMTQSRREKLDDDLARRWLEKNAPNATPKPRPHPRERWQMRRQEQKQERRALAKPLLKGVE